MAAVANTTTDILHKILSRGLRVLRPRLAMTQTAIRDFEGPAQEAGDTVNVPVPARRVAQAVAPNNVPPTPTAKTRETVPIPLDQWYHDDFGMTDKELRELRRNEHFVPMGLQESIDALGTQINQSMWELTYRFYNFVGSGGTANSPFNSNTDLADTAYRVLNTERALRSERRMLVDFKAEEDAKKAGEFQDASAAGSSSVILEGMIGRKKGFDWLSDDDVPLHTKGTGASRTVSGAHAVGVKTIAVTGGTGTFLQGDIIKFAGGGANEMYSVQADESGGNLTIEPALKTALSGSEAISYSDGWDAAYTFDTARENLALQRNAIAFVSRTRAMSESDRIAGAQFASLTDPVTGVTLRLEVIRQYKQTMWDLDALWGRAVVRPELGVRVLGQQT